MKVRVKKYYRFNNPFYAVECREHDGNWISFVETFSEVLSKEIAKLIRKNPTLVHGMGYLFDE
jgi:hypothetical protein